MSKFGINSGSGTEIIKHHLDNLDEPVRSTFIELREFIFSLGNNVIEEVRPHRIVYAKSLTFRTFLDLRPSNSSIMIQIRKDRKTPPEEFNIVNSDQFRDIKQRIAQAYNNI
jgi:hypothetical protein